MFLFFFLFLGTLQYAQRNHFLCGFCEKEMVRQQQKNTEPSHIFFWNTKEEKNSHCVYAYMRYAGRNHSLSITGS